MKRTKNGTNGFSRRNLVSGLSAGVAAAGAGAAAAANEKWDHSADVVVIGFGGAGACAAISAHDAGAEVLLVEKQPEATHAPNTRMSGGNFHVPDRSGSRAALVAYARGMISGDNVPGKMEGEQPWGVGEKLAEIWAEYCPENLAFMQSLDPEFKAYYNDAGAAHPHIPGAKDSGYRVVVASYTGAANKSGVSTKDRPKAEKTNGDAFFACLKTGIAARSKIRTIYDSPARGLITNDAGEVIGVVAGKDGVSQRIRARRAVIITSGGYEYSVGMRHAFLDGAGIRGWAFAGSPANTGDGIAMALKVGAALAKPGKAEGPLVIGVPVPEYAPLKVGSLVSGLGAAGSIVVSNHGSRYANETYGALNPIDYVFNRKVNELDIVSLDYPNVPSWLVFDETFRAARPLASATIGAVGFGLFPWSKDNLDAVNRGWILKADTIEALGEKIKAHEDNRKLMDGAKLSASVASFNAACAAGSDQDFGRKVKAGDEVAKPPFYALPLYPGGPNTSGGLSANGDRQVLDWYGKPIPRLYTAGEISSVHKYAYQGGGNLSECIVMGRMAGMRAAALKAWG